MTSLKLTVRYTRYLLTSRATVAFGRSAAMVRVVLVLLLSSAVLGPLGAVAVRGQEATPGTLGGPRLDVMIDRAALPGDEGFVLFGRNVFQPNTRQTFADRGEVGTIAIVVEEGTLTYELEELGGRIFRGATTAAPVDEEAPAGSPFTLEAGDALVFEAGGRVEANESDAPVSYLFAVILEPVGPPPPDPSNVGEVTSTVLGTYDGPWMALPDGPVLVSWEQTTVDVGEWLPSVTGGMQATAQETGTPGDLLIGGDGAAYNSGDEPVAALVLTLSPLGTVAATPMGQTMAGASPVADTAETTTEPIATVSLLAEAMPALPAIFDAWTGRLAPGESLEFPSYEPSVSIAADVVVEGEYAAQSEGRMQLQRGGAIEEVEPGTEMSLGMGDAVVYVENAAAQQMRNPGDTETRVVTFGVFSVAPPVLEYPGVVSRTDWERSGLAESDVAVTVERVTIPAGGRLALEPDSTAPRFYAVHEGTVEWALTQPDGQMPVLRFFPGQMIRFRALDEGQMLELRNPGAEPVVLLQLTLGPSAAAAATPVP
ncbi:MAG: hypothetical protein K0Q71_3219 [Thermomicrobiales bacterium]|nr:hypothetical protein [Thermomicrobiales bacterium]